MRTMIDPGERIIRAKDDTTVTSRSRRIEQKFSGGLEIRRVAVVALTAEAVVALRPRIAPRLLEVVKRGPKRRSTQSAYSCCKLVTEAGVDAARKLRVVAGRKVRGCCRWGV